MATRVIQGRGFVGLNLVEALLVRGKKVVWFEREHLPPVAWHVLSKHGDPLAVVNDNVQG